MAITSIFGRGGDGMTSGGLDGYIGPPAGDFSSLPESIADPISKAEPEIPLDCDGKDRDEPACQIARAEKEAAKE